METTQALKSGTTLHRGVYRVDRVLGQGGFGITYLATDLTLDRRVAIKEFFSKDYCDRDGATSRVTPGTGGGAELVGRLRAKFLKEARNIAKLDHPGVIKIHAAFEENGTAYYVMDYIDGESLSDIVRRDGALPAGRALRYVEGVGESLRYVHGRRINHLDVKPANIMVRRSDDRPVLIDFGLSKQYGTDGRQTSTTPVGISHGYAPMEQYDSGGVSEFSPSTDVYSLGATLYYLLTGVTPPRATSLIDGELVFPSTVPSWLVPAIRRAMSPSRKGRPRTVDEFLSEISGRTQIDPAPTPVPQPGPTPDPKPQSNRKRWYLIGAVVAVAAIAGLAYFLWGSGGDREDAAQVSDVSDATGYTNGHEWVDLGLPSGTKWATCNVGATSPEDYGDYFAWGETSTKGEYTDGNSVTYSKGVSDLQSQGYIDSSGNLTRQHDAAAAKWGSGWRMPTKAQCEELSDKCEWRWTDRGGHTGYIVTGPNGNTIFLPAAGYRDGSLLLYAGNNSRFWSATVNEVRGAYDCAIGSSEVAEHLDIRLYGYSVRPVSE